MAKATTGKEALLQLLKDAPKKYNGLAVGSMDEVAAGVVAITTGNLAIDYAIGVGGIPLGRSVELYGPPSSGKTTTALQMAVALQKLIKAGGGILKSFDGKTEIEVGPDDVIIYFDYEQAMDKDYATALGLDVKHPSLKFTQPDTLEDGVNFAINAVKTGVVKLCIFDSVASMNPSSKAEAEIGKSLPAIQAKLMKDFTLQFNTVLANNNATALFINHQMEKLEMGGSRPGMPAKTTTPGGAALKFFASLRIQYVQIKQNKESVMDPLSNSMVERVMSTDVKVKVTKNKVAPPFREATVRVRFGKGFDNFWSAMQVLLANKQVLYAASYYKFHNVESMGLAPEWMPRSPSGTKPPVINGTRKLFQAADAHPEWRQGIIELAEKVVQDNIEILSKVVPTKQDDEEEESEIDSETEAELSSLSAGDRVEL